jgi:hypothetical protein
MSMAAILVPILAQTGEHHEKSAAGCDGGKCYGRGGFPMSVDAFTRQGRRAGKRETRRNASASVVIPFPPASRRPAHRKVERKVKTAASDFMNAILKVSAGLVVADEHAAILSARIGRYQAATFIASFDPPPARGPDNLFPRGDRSGRVVVIWQDERGAPHRFYERRSRALARLTAPDRQAFIEAVKACPGAALEAVHEVRATFARALRGVRARDAVMMMGARP